MTDGGIGQQSFHIFLENRRERTQQEGTDACASHQPQPFLRTRQHRPQQNQQENPRFHHSGRVQIRRHRRGRSHSVRQPKMEGKLGTFGKSAQRHQQ